jgi:hypothetical protein
MKEFKKNSKNITTDLSYEISTEAWKQSQL